MSMEASEFNEYRKNWKSKVFLSAYHGREKLTLSSRSDYTDQQIITTDRSTHEILPRHNPFK